MKAIIFTALFSVSIFGHSIFGTDSYGTRPLEEQPIFCTEARNGYDEGKLSYETAHQMVIEHLNRLEAANHIDKWEVSKDGETFNVITSMGTNFTFTFAEE